jgi:hypothetical protein
VIILFQINNNEEAPRSSGVVQSDPTRICRRPRNFLGKALDLPGSEVPQEVKRDDYTHRRPRAGATALDVDGDSALFALAIGGLFYVKWSPYYAKVLRRRTGPYAWRVDRKRQLARGPQRQLAGGSCVFDGVPQGDLAGAAAWTSSRCRHRGIVTSHDARPTF